MPHKHSLLKLGYEYTGVYDTLYICMLPKKEKKKHTKVLKMLCITRKRSHVPPFPFYSLRWNIYIFFSFFGAAPVAYGDSQAMDRIGAAAAGLCHSHSREGSLTHGARPGLKHASSWILVWFGTTEPRRELLLTHFLREIIPHLFS